MITCRMVDHGTTEIHIQSVLASIHHKENNETLGINRLTKTRGIMMGSIWNTDCACA